MAPGRLEEVERAPRPILAARRPRCPALHAEVARHSQPARGRKGREYLEHVWTILEQRAEAVGILDVGARTVLYERRRVERRDLPEVDVVVALEAAPRVARRAHPA